MKTQNKLRYFAFPARSVMQLFISFLLVLMLGELHSQRSCVSLAQSDDALNHYQLMDLMFDDQGSPRYEGQVLDSIAYFNCDSLCDRYRYTDWYFYLDDQIYIAEGLSVEYGNSSFKLSTTDDQYWKNYGYRDNCLNDYEFYIGESPGSSSTSTGRHSISRRADGKINHISISSEYSGGFFSTYSGSNSYHYSADTLMSIEIFESGYISGVDPPNWSDSTLVEYAYLPDEYLVRENSFLKSKYTCAVDDSTDNLIEAYYDYDNGDWVLKSVTTFTQNLLPISELRYHLDNPFYLTNYHYSDTITNQFDFDGDGFFGPSDCDETNPEVNVGQSEIPYNGIDDDCNSNTWDDDVDKDGYLVAVDCDDTDSSVHPGAEDLEYTIIDENCDGFSDTLIGIHFLKFNGFDSPAILAGDALCVGRGYEVYLNAYQEYDVYYWEIEDLGVRESESHLQSIRFNETGVKTITVECVDSLGQSKIYTDSIVVVDWPVVVWTSEILSNGQVQFYANGENFNDYLWDFGDGHTSTAKDPIHTYVMSPGIFDVSLTTSNVCGSRNSTQVLFVTSSTSTSNLESFEVDLYPNPSNGLFHLKFPLKRVAFLELIDTNGRKCWSSNWNSKEAGTLDLRHMPAGVYSLRVYSDNKLVERRLVITN